MGDIKDIKPIEKVVWVAAKTGLFFAKADGIYDVREKNFIEGFIDKLSAVGPVDDVKAELDSLLTKNETLDNIVSETKDLLSNFTPVEQEVIKEVLQKFVSHVINADFVEKEEETLFFKEWKKAIK